jgi:hypothetical protein
VTFLRRPATAPATRLADAVAGWVAEWIPDEPSADRDLTVWVGASAQDGLHLPGARLQAL